MALAVNVHAVATRAAEKANRRRLPLRHSSHEWTEPSRAPQRGSEHP